MGRRSHLTTACLIALAASAPATAQATRVVVAHDPVGISVRAHGRTVLRTVAVAKPSGGTLYGALTFTTGAEPELRPPQLGAAVATAPRVTRSRRWHATRVRSVSRHPGGRIAVRLATNDPGGREILLDVATGQSTVTLRARVTGGRASAIAMAFASPPHEAFHGFGGRRESTNLRGRSFDTWVEDYRYPDPSTGYYAPQAAFISSSGYGAWLAGDAIAHWRLSLRQSRRLAGRARRALAAPRHRDRPSRPGHPGADRDHRPSSGRPGLEHGTDAVAGDRDRGRRAGGRLRGPGPRRRRAPALPPLAGQRLRHGGLGDDGSAAVTGTIRRLADRGIRTILYLRSFVADDIAGTEAPGTFQQAVARGYVAMTATGAPYLIDSPFPGAHAAVIDFTDPAARAWWTARVRALLDTGASGFMNDFGEQVAPAMHFDDGSTGATMHNRYPRLQAQVTRAAVRGWERDHPGRPDVFFFQRAGFSGSPGSVAYESAEFPGDETVDWSRQTGLASIVPDMLNRAVTGAVGFTTDIGGYAQFTAGRPSLPPTPAQLFTRWSQAAALTPFFRVHNSGLSGAQMPWGYDLATQRRWVAMARLHQRAVPLIRRLWRRSVATGMPMTRPLWLVDPRLAASPRADDEWMLGRDLVVAPVLRPGQRRRAVCCPPAAGSCTGGPPGCAARGRSWSARRWTCCRGSAAAARLRCAEPRAAHLRRSQPTRMSTGSAHTTSRPLPQSMRSRTPSAA